MTNLIEKEILIDVISNPGDTFYENVLSDFLDEQNIEHDFRKPLHNNTVTKIKPYQEKCLDIWANHWINIGLCTKPTDEIKAEQYFCDLYKQLGFSKFNIIWCNNPIEMFNQIKNWQNIRVDDLLLSQTCNQINRQVLSQVENQVNKQINSQTHNILLNQTWNKASFQVASMRYSTRSYIRSQINNLVWNQIRNYIWYGQQDADWFSFFAYYMQVLRIEAPKQFVPFMLLAQEVNWWIPTEQTVYATKKPKECIVEDWKFVKLVYQDNCTIT
jgi:hypothetical protein